MLTFKEVKETIEKYSQTTTPLEREDKQAIAEVAVQLGFSIPDPNCNCKDKYHDLIIKLQLWLRAHQDGFCHYEIAPGIVRKGSKGQNVYNLNLTDEEAEWLIENDPVAARYIKRILPDETEETKPEETDGPEETKTDETDGPEELFTEGGPEGTKQSEQPCKAKKVKKSKKG